MTKVASEILYVTNGKGDIAKLRNEIKSVEASQQSYYGMIAKSYWVRKQEIMG